MGFLDSYLSERRFFQSKVLNNVFLLNFFSFLSGLIFTSPMLILYLHEQLASTTEVSAVLSVQSLFHSLFELPSGFLADLRGRKFALVCCAIVRTVGLVSIMIIHQVGNSIGIQKYYLFFISAALEGISQSLHSGSDIALLYDSLKNQGKIEKFKSCLAFKAVMWPSAAAVASFVGGFIGNHHGIFIPMGLTAAASLLSILVAMCLKEVEPQTDIACEQKLIPCESTTASVDSTVSSAAAIIHSNSSPALSSVDSAVPQSPEPMSPETRSFLTNTSGVARSPQRPPSILSHCSVVFAEVRSSRQIQSLIVSSLLLYAFSESTHRLRTVFYQAQGIPNHYFGILGGLTFALSSVGAFNSTKLAHKFGTKLTLEAAVALTPAMQFISTIAGTFLCSILLLLVSFLFGIRGPLLSALLHDRVSPNCRATIFSLQSLANKLSLSLCLPFLAGPLIDKFGIHSTIQLFAVLTAIPVFWIHFALEDEKSAKLKIQ